MKKAMPALMIDLFGVGWPAVPCIANQIDRKIEQLGVKK